MSICTKLAKFSGMILGMLAGILLLLGIIGYIMWTFYESSFLGVANFWNYLYASVPFSLLAICCATLVIAGKNKN